MSSKYKSLKKMVRILVNFFLPLYAEKQQKQKSKNKTKADLFYVHKKF